MGLHRYNGLLDHTSHPPVNMAPVLRTDPLTKKMDQTTVTGFQEKLD